MATTKKRKNNLIVSYKNLSEELKEKFKEAYPDGYSDHLQRFTKPNGDVIFVVPFETPETNYMVKFEVVIDTLGEDLDKALFDDDDDSGKEDEFAPISEALEKEEIDPSHKERVLRHGDFETNIEEDEKRKKKLTLGINKEEIRAAFGDDDAEEDMDYDISSLFDEASGGTNELPEGTAVKDRHFGAVHLNEAVVDAAGI